MNTKAKRAIIVEDCLQMRDLIKMALGAVGIQEILEAGDGIEALAILKSEAIDIVIMDRKMSNMDGLECTRLIRAGIDGIDPRTPIILLTGIKGRESEEASYAAGASNYLEKPFSITQLHAVLEPVLRNSVRG